MGITIFLIIAVVVVALVFAQRLNARRLLRDEQRSTTGLPSPSPSPGSPSGSSDEITARIEDEVERMGITVAPEEIKRIAEQIRAAKASGEGPDEEPEQVVDGDARRPAPSVQRASGRRRRSGAARSPSSWTWTCPVRGRIASR